MLLPSRSALALEAAAEAVAEGASLAGYRFDTYRTGERPGGLGRLVIITESPSDALAVAAGAARGARIAASVALARDLVNEPPSSLTPQQFAESFVRRFRDVPGLTVEVWDEQRIADERLGGLLGVARGSTQPPRLVRVDYEPADPVDVDGRVPHLVLVGKGITFDSGGLSLKTADGMETMKTDMGGAAAVLGALDAVAALGARIRITALTPLTENMPGGSAIKPGDVLTTRNGKTIEVLNTDAEGRLVLADALSLAVEAGADAIVDVATLTGAAVVALGKEIAGLLGNDEALLAGGHRGVGPGRRAGVDRCRCPTTTASHIDSEIADMRNIGRPGQAGSISAAMLLPRVRGRRALGAPRHRRARPVGREHPLPDQGRHRVRRPPAGGAGHLGGVRPVAGPGRGPLSGASDRRVLRSRPPVPVTRSPATPGPRGRRPPRPPGR